MKVRVRLFGLLSRRVSGYDHKAGMTVEVPEGTTCRDVARMLQLSDLEAGLFSVAGILKGPNDEVHDGDELSIFMPITGG